MRILFVCLVDSPHAARWINCIADNGWDLHMFGHAGWPPNKLFRDVTLHRPIRPSEGLEQPGAAKPQATAPAIAARALRFLNHARRHPAKAARLAARKALARMRSADAPPGLAEPPSLRVATFSPAAPGTPGERIRFGETDADCDALHGPAVLAEVIRRVKPDLIHSMEFQHCAYLVLAARDLVGADPFPPWLATNWGSDIFLFGREPAHETLIRRVLAAATLYSCECHRDVAIGRAFGYGGPDLPVLPNSGGLDLKRMEPLRSGLKPSERRQIMVKGYDHFAGRAMIALDVVERFADRLQGYEVVLYSAGPRPRERALALKAAGKLDIRIIDFTEHDEIISNFGRSRFYLGISISDGISTSVIEAMAMGCFPIQTDTSCCDEWFESGVGGLAVPVDDVEEISRSFARALADDALVDHAAHLNRQVVERRLDTAVVTPKVRDFYEQALRFVRTGERGNGHSPSELDGNGARALG